MVYDNFYTANGNYRVGEITQKLNMDSNPAR